jgi:hypothetical protein
MSAADAKAKPCEPFVVKHYSSDARPTIKGNGFDGLEVGCDRMEAEEFVSFLNARLALPPLPPEVVAVLREALNWTQVGEGEPEGSDGWELCSAVHVWIAAGRPGLLPAGKEGKK